MLSLLELLSWTNFIDCPCLGSKGSFPPLGCWKESDNGIEEDPSCLLLSLHLSIDSSALEDSQVAYHRTKGTVLPIDREKFMKMREEATLCSSLLVC